MAHFSQRTYVIEDEVEWITVRTLALAAKPLDHMQLLTTINILANVDIATATACIRQLLEKKVIRVSGDIGAQRYRAYHTKKRPDFPQTLLAMKLVRDNH